MPASKCRLSHLEIFYLPIWLKVSPTELLEGNWSHALAAYRGLSEACRGCPCLPIALQASECLVHVLGFGQLLIFGGKSVNQGFWT